MAKDARLDKCQQIIQYEFSDLGLLKQALTHASASPSRSASNERLEFLGDAILGLVVCQEIYTIAPRLTEGQMTKIKSSVVSRSACARVAQRLGLTELLILGKGVTSAARLPSSLSAAVFEAVVGAIYVDGGLAPAREFLLRELAGVMEASMASQHQRNYKSLLQQYVQREFNVTPQYDLLDEKGPEHAKCFELAVRINGRQYPSAWGSFKKQAEQKAALAALRELGILKGPEAETADEQDHPD
jgi:ribonuclease-3